MCPVTTQIPVGLFYGSAEDGTILLASNDLGNDDNGTPFAVRMATDYIAPSGAPVAESIFTALFVTLTWEGTPLVVVTPVVDDVVYDADGPFDLRYLIQLPAVTKRTTRTFLVPLYEVIFDPISGTTPIARVALRGEWAGAKVETSGAFTGFFEFDEAQVEFEPISESHEPAPTT